MKIKPYIFILLCSLRVSQICFGQSVDISQTPVDLVQNTLLGGGVTANNITYTGNLSQIGYFFGSSNLSISTGIIISTGQAIDASGPNDASGTSTDLFSSGDPTLDNTIAATGLTTNDAFVLEFDFIPLSDTVSFRYVFASEEYMEYANSTFNDVFGFFISGPGIPVPTNIALLPDNTTIVSINNVNATNNSAYYVDNGDGISPNSGQTVQYDGFTKVLTATTEVIACEVYHIKIAIADVGDGAFDSSVYLEAGSFSSGSISLTSQADYSSSINDTALFEGCGTTKIIFERSGNTSQPLTIDFAVTGTATQGVDYSLSANSVTIPAGFNIATIDLNSLIDNINEPGGETVIITPIITVACAQQSPPSITLTLADQPTLTVNTSPDVTNPCPQQTTFEAFPQGGVPGYIFEWRDSTGSIIGTQSTITVFPLRTTHYYITVSDTCRNQQASDTVSVIIPGYIPMQFSINPVSLCKGDTVTVVVNVTDGKQPYTYFWPSSGSTNNYTSLSPAYSNSFSVEVTDLCGIIDTAWARVSVVGPKAAFVSSQIAERDFVFTNQSIDAIYYYWNFGDGDTAQTLDAAHSFPDSGWYNVLLTVENREGCFDTARLLIHAFPDFNIYIPNAFTPNGDGKNDVFYVTGEGFATSDMKIFDRWGQEVYHSKHQEWAWDGLSRKGIKLEGMFCYVFEFITPLGNSFKRIGHVLVVR